MNKIWFKRKQYGWGWVPASWEGWFVLIDYFFALALIAWFFDVLNNSIGGFLSFVIVTALVLVIVYMTGEAPRGHSKKDETNEEK